MIQALSSKYSQAVLMTNPRLGTIAIPAAVGHGEQTGPLGDLVAWGAKGYMMLSIVMGVPQ